MAVNFEWNVSDCEVYPSKSGKSNVVHKVHYELKGTDDTNTDSDGKNYFAVSRGRVYLDTSDLSSFINWSSLSASDVQGWCEMMTMPRAIHVPSWNDGVPCIHICEHFAKTTLSANASCHD